MSDIFRDYSFGGWIHYTRVKNKITLRELSNRLKTDAGNISKLERNELPPPKKLKRVKEICEALESIESIELMASLAFQHHLTELQKEFRDDD